MPREIAQTRLLVPTVNCSENVPYDHNPAYPAAPANDQDFDLVNAYALAWQDWAIDADKALDRANGKRRVTAECLGKLRGNGLIN